MNNDKSKNVHEPLKKEFDHEFFDLPEIEYEHICKPIGDEIEPDSGCYRCYKKNVYE